MAAKTSKRFHCPKHWSLAQRLDRKTDRSGGPDACWPWKGDRSPRGYGRLTWKGNARRAHRLTWMEANGSIPEGMYVCHRCDNPPCCNPAHLRLDTHAGNMRDRNAKGRVCRTGAPPGERNGKAKLTAADVRAIRAAAGTQSEIAKRFGIARTTARQIRLRRRWQHLV